MKKIIVTILIILMMLLSSCSPKNTNDTVQLWWYDWREDGAYDPYFTGIEAIIKKLKIYCDSNNIPFEAVNYSAKTITYSDYVLKRNVAMTKGNMITLDFLGNMHDLMDNNADYSKLENYDNLIDAYKGRFCIPLGVQRFMRPINNKVLEYYDISTERNVISYYDYLDIKQQMKEKGAKLKLNMKSHYDTLLYYTFNNGLYYIDKNSEILKNKETFKFAIKKTLIDLYKDFKLYYEDLKDFDYLEEELGKSYYYEYDYTSNLTFNDGENVYNIAKYNNIMKLGEDIVDRTFVVTDGGMYFPTAFMYKKVTNNKTYEVFDQLLDETYFKLINSGISKDSYLPTTDTEKIRNLMEVDENWQHNGIFKNAKTSINKKTEDVANDIYDIIIKDKEKSKYMADSFFNNNELANKIIEKIDELLQKLITENLDYNEKDVDNMINKELDDFILNFNIHYN